MKENVISILKKVGAIITPGHFVGVSGKHMDTYINKDALFPHTESVSRIGKMFAEKCKNLDIDVVVAPALGGIILSQWTAYHLSRLKGKEIFGVYTEKTPDRGQIFTRGYDAYVKNKNVLVVEDSVTTGSSVKKVVDSVRGAGGNVVGVCVMVNKDPETVNEISIGAPFSELSIYKVSSFDPFLCPLCKNKVPINTNIGHGKDFLNSQKLQGKIT